MLTPTRIAFALVLAVASAGVAEPPRRFALVAGVQKYDGTEFASLRFAENDAVKLATLLRDDAKFDQVVLLSDKEAFAKENEALFPTAPNIRQQLDALLKLVGPADTLLVAFAGHGVQLQKPAGMFFCPKKADLTKPDTLVALDSVYRTLQAKPAGFRLLLVDACRNDPLTSRAKTVDNLQSLTRPEVPKPPGGVAALFSCSAGERAFEDEESKHGFFFRSVLDGLSGKAADAAGNVNLLSLATYVQREVPLAVQRRFQNPNSVQKPELFFEGQSPVLMRATGASEFVNSIEMTLVRIPDGDGIVGSPPGERGRVAGDEERRKIHIAKPFYLSVTPVTQKQYQAVTAESPSWYSATGSGRSEVAGLDTGGHPVEQVSWDDARKFCELLTKREPNRRYRLPTSDEWEYAARAGTETAYPWGDDPKRLDEHGWFMRNSADHTQPVGRKRANGWGLSDMHGNVWQWTADALGDGRVARGGGWDSPPADCRSARVRGFGVDERKSNLGFRVVCEVTKQ
ncbi:MAG: SUMF1/EgtB/PvdO family nonheme iron enzyme [Gemmataceae bacterium]